MCFKWFKKRKVEATRLSQEELKWNKMMKMWADGSLESPYAELLEYMNGVNDGGHYMHFDNVVANGDLKQYVDNVAQILPDKLRKNIKKAYDAYIENPDDMSDENNAVLDECDKVYYDNEEAITLILKTRATQIEL